MRNWLPFVIMTILSWGMYIPTLHRGQMGLSGSGVHAFLMVGIAYVLVAIAIPGMMVVRAGSWSTFTPQGSLFTLGIVLALVNGGRPNVVPPLVFAGAPVVSVFVAMLYNPPREAPSPLFFIGILMAAAGAFLVLSNRPQ